LPKLIISILLTSLVYFLTCLIVVVPEKFKNALNAQLKTQDEETIKLATYIYNNTRQVFYRSMKSRYVLFYIITISCTLLFMYYIMAFCAVYSTAAEAWLTSSVTNIILSWGVFQFFNPISSGLVRSIVKSNPNYL
jgi:hypothetical protein